MCDVDTEEQANTHDVCNVKGRAMLDDASDLFKGPLQQRGSWKPAVSIQWSTGGGQEMGSGLQSVDDRLYFITNNRHAEMVRTGCVSDEKRWGKKHHVRVEMERYLYQGLVNSRS